MQLLPIHFSSDTRALTCSSAIALLLIEQEMNENNNRATVSIGTNESLKTMIVDPYLGFELEPTVDYA